MTTDTANKTVQELASEAFDCLVKQYRADDGSGYVCVREGSPEWVRDLCFAAHGDMPPDDWRYECIQSALECIAESTGPDDEQHGWADDYVDVNNGQLTIWLGSHGSRPDYCDEAMEEYGEPVSKPIMEIIQLGQYTEACEVYGLVLDYLDSL